MKTRTWILPAAALLVSLNTALAQTTLTVVSPPNPHVFPLLIALAENPNLPVRLVAVSGSSDIETAFDNGADVLLAMTYVGAKQRSSGAVPDLELVLPVTWRGFWEVAASGVTSFQDLKGETVVVSGPAGPGQGGGADIIFRAAAKRQGINPDTDLTVLYAPVSQAQGLLQSGAAQAIAVPSPASTGFVMQSSMAGGNLQEAIDFQAVFSGYPSFPAGQLPLGGIFTTASALSDPEKTAALKILIQAYADAASKLENQPMRYASVAVDAFQNYFGGTGAPVPPAPVLVASILNGDLVYRTDVPLSAVRCDLNTWLEELLGGAPPDAGFYAADVATPTNTASGPRGPAAGLFQSRSGSR